ncbi:MAG: PIG-L family deacetylase [Anaerolineales bacterium]|nr:PIG-L family deacetylase [Anaerolineales bacterium]
MTQEEYIPPSFLAIFAHPDDIEFSCAGTTAKWAKAGARAAYVLVTSGDVGIAEPGMTNERAAEIREAETLAAAKAAGVEEVVFLRVPDGMVENNIELRRRLVREIRRFRPETIITGDPTILFTTWGGVNHPDHRAVGGAVLDAVFPASGQPNLFQEFEQEGLTAHKVRKIYVVSWTDGETVVDITETMETKINALAQHVSQIGHMEGLAERMRERAADRAKDHDFEYGERFRVLTIESDETWQRLQETYPEQYGGATGE